MIAPLVSIKIYAPNGKAYYSDAAQTSTDFPVTDSCERSAKLMGDDYVRLVFKSADKVTFAAFSYIEYGGQTFFLKEQYIPTPNGCMKDANGVSSAYYSYDVKFVSVGNMLSKATCYRHVVVSGTDGGEWDEPEITLNGTLETMYVIVMGAIQQYCKRIEDSDCAHFRTLLATIPANGLTKVGGVTSPNTEKVKLTAGTELVSFSFQGDNIANVCTTIANSYTDDDKDTEWYITEDSSHSLTLHFAKCEDTDSVTAGTIPQYSDYTIANTSADKDLKPYRTGGLSKVEYAQEWSGIAQTIVPFGSERNMSGVWRKDTDAETQMVVTFGKRLRLDKSHRAEITNANGTKTTYKGAYAVKNRKGETVILPVNAQGGVTNPDVSTGIEEVKFFDDIYPQCHFRVTSVSVRNKKQDDDIVPEYTIEAVPITSTKEQLVANGFYPLTIEEATTLSVRFESGLLNGREFEIANKTHKDADATTYSLKFTIVADGSLEDGTLIPSGNFIPKGDDTKGEGNGDEFALFNMKMPQEYVELAQQELAQRAYDELIELQETRPEVKCTTDPVHFDGELYFGQVMAIKSELFGGADNEFISRVISFSHKLTTPASVSFSLASAIMQGVLSEMNNAISDVTNITGDLGQRAINLSRRGWRDASEVADMLDSITAEMMLVGNEKYQFAFTSGISCVNNTTADSSGVVHFQGLKITYGTLQHTQEPYINYANKGVWELPSTTPLLTTDHNGETLNADTPYYLYAVVADDGNAARYELWGNNEDSRADDEAYLLLGVLSSEFEDNGVAARVFSRTNGYTAIEGGTITTEQIQDAGRNLIIDFQSNPPRIIARNGAEIIGNIRFKAGDSQTAEEQLKALGLLAEDAQSTADAAQSALDNLQIGGENLYYLANPLTLTATSTDNTYYYILLENLENGKKYTFSCEKSVRLAGTATKYSVVLYNFATNTIAQYYDLSIGNTRQTCTFTVPADNGNWRLLIYAGVKGSTAGNSLQWTDIMIQKGNKTTAYQQPAWKPLYNKGISISYSGTAEAAYLDLLYNIPAGTYKATMGYEKRGDGAEQDVSGAYSNSCVVWYKAGGDGYSDVLAITDWGETVQIAQAADVVVYTGVKSFIEAHIEDPGTTGVYFPADGTWYIAAARILTYVTDSIAGSAAEAKTKAAALDYLKAALTDGSTQVAGGLLMTNVLMLKNLAGAVTAGMSGLTKKTGTSTADNVLLWGGGNYEEAFYAANNANYYKSSSSTTPITTLIKKDGTGKIGIFKISNTQVEINVPNQGKIIIDGSTTKAGIIMYDTSGNEKLKIIPRSISNSSDIPKAPTTETHASFNGAGVYEMYTNDTYEFEIGDYLTVDDYNRETTITYNVSAYIRATPNQGTTTDAQAQIKLWLQRLDGQGTYNIATISSNKYTINEDEEGNLAMSGYGTFTQVLSSGSVWKLMCSIGRATSTIDVVGYAINSQTSIKWTYLQRYPYTPKVILGLDGLLCANDYEHFFKLYTGAGGGTQQIIMEGLPTSATHLTTGQLYRSGTYLRIV